MMVRDLAKQLLKGVPLIGPAGLYGIQDGGASSVVCGHEVLMKVIDHMKAKGVPIERFLFAPTSCLDLEVMQIDRQIGR